MGEFWTLTQQLLQGDEPLIKRPKLTDALLNKPPFRFLHDIISEVTRTTGFADGLFTEEELVSTNIKDKDGKVAYLTKIINCVGLALDQNVPARPLKIVAGLEPENTNRFLQMLAEAATSGSPSSQLAVQKVLAGEQMTAKGGADRSQRTSESFPPAPQPEGSPALAPPPPATEPVSRGPARPASSQSEARRASTPALDPSRGHPAQESGERPASGVGEKAAPSSEPAGAARAEPVRRTSTAEAPKAEGRAAEGRTGSAAQQQRQQQPPAAVTTSQLADDDDGPRQREPESGSKVEPSPPVAPQPATPAPAQRPGTASRGPMRPQSARRGPPKLPTNVVTPDKKPETRPGPAPGSVPPGSGPLERTGSARKSGREATPPAAVPPAAIIPAVPEDDDDDEGITIVDSHPVADDVSLPEGAGKLVRDILETRKDLEKSEDGAALGRTLSMNGKTDSVKKEELARLRGVVQSLCQSATPLGKSMEYLQEDLENMGKEFHHWNKEKKQHAAKLDEERRLTQEALQAPLSQLADLEDEIKQKREALDTLKAQVWRNDETIQGLLKLVMAGPSGGAR
ncbi:hypothetical protein KFL_002860130 [Klebsormidium nitens]|uniref:TRAF3-interacting protein 1 n=1 Tax=Klebsormidium nitens TaxID=105231 RepID=A0A1Y1IAD1_KLENI|nr:hypothetical protein KFL_002860130 [Klebsormidium nitens]|eukprot:GAQ86389.1 hypothetical protein KFL_002860130 [Klebsormidium nitens]